MWSYTVDDLATNQASQVRFLIQDTQETRPLVQDEEIAWLLTQEANVYTAAAAACDILVARGGSVKSKKVGDLAIEYDVAFYRSLATRLRARGTTYQTPYAGGLSIADKLAQDLNPDAVSPFFFRTLGDAPGADQPSPNDVRNPLDNPNAL